MSVLIGHASADENGRASGGQAGDQTGAEVCVRLWYAGGWNVVLRPKSATVAERMATSCETLCRGNLMGYDQLQRNTSWVELEKVGWDVTKLKTPCGTDCSSLMSLCARCAGINVPRVALGGGRYNAPVTQTMRSAFVSTGAFEVLTDPKYLMSDRYLKRGDILLRESGHTAMVLTNGELSGVSTTTPDTSAPATATPNKEVVATGIAYCRDTALAGTYECSVELLSVCDAAGCMKKVLTQIKRGMAVNCWGGYYSLYAGDKWLYVQFVQGDTSYTGFVCAENLIRIAGF